MIIRKLVLLFIAMTCIISCSFEERDRLPNITPNYIELSTAQPEGYFQVSPRDYDMYGFKIDEQEEYKITDGLKENEVTVVDISNGNKATFYCNNHIIEKIEFSFITIKKIQKGKYKVQLNENIGIQKPRIILFGFSSSDGISPVVINLK